MSSFREAKLGYTPSCAWRGIWESKQDLMKGCRWRVGNEKSIIIWADFWLPEHRLIPQSQIYLEFETMRRWLILLMRKHDGGMWI